MPHTFTHASGSFTFTRQPLRPRPSLDLQQAKTNTASGVTFGHDPLVDDQIESLHCPVMSDNELSALRTFFDDVTGGMAETFTWTDMDSNNLTVRFAAPEIMAIEKANDCHDVTILLLRV